MKKIWAYLISGLFFMLVMEFMFQFQIQNNLIGFLMTPIIQIPFLLFAYFTSRFLFKNSRFHEFFIFIVYGLIGLFIIEWLYVGNTPWGNPDAVQWIMVSYWGGAIIFARIMTSKNQSISKLKKWMIWYFAIYTILAIGLGFLIPFEERLGIIVLMAVVGYGIMNIFYFWFFAKKFREK